MARHERAGQPARPEDLVDVASLVTAYYTAVPDPEDVDQQVAFGTSGHRGSALDTAFNEGHILATTQAICDYRREQGTTGPPWGGLYLNPPSRGGLCEGVTTIPSASPPPDPSRLWARIARDTAGVGV